MTVLLTFASFEAERLRPLELLARVWVERVLAPPKARPGSLVLLAKVVRGSLDASRGSYRSEGGPSRTSKNLVQLRGLWETSSLALIDLAVGVTC